MPSNVESPVDLKSALKTLGAAGVPWYLVLDAAQEPPVLPAAGEAGLATTCLYTGDFGRRLDNVAPHLAAFDPDSAFTEWLHRHWQYAHGILLQSSAPFEEVRRHLKSFLMAKNPEGRTVRFRYYDPRVLRAFLPVCTATELGTFFGPIAAFYAAGRPGPTISAYSLGRRQLQARSLSLVPRPTEPAAAPLTESADLHVIVLDAVLGTPIERAAVVIEGADRRSAVTGQGGRVRFGGMPLGPYQIYSIDGERREGRCGVDLNEDSDPVFLLCRGRPTPAAVTS